MERAIGMLPGYGESFRAETLAEILRRSEQPEIAGKAHEIAEIYTRFSDELSAAVEKLEKAVFETCALNAEKVMTETMNLLKEFYL